MHIFCATRIGDYIFLQHCNSGWGGHNIFDHQIGRSQKYCRGTFGNLWPPYSKENGGPLNKCGPCNAKCNVNNVLHRYILFWFPPLIFILECKLLFNVHDVMACLYKKWVATNGLNTTWMYHVIGGKQPFSWQNLILIKLKLNWTEFIFSHAGIRRRYVE